MQRAFREAKRWQHDFVGTEHLLYGLLCDADGPAVVLLRSLNATPDLLLAKVELSLQRHDGGMAMEKFPLSPASKRVFRSAADEAGQFRHQMVGPEHLLLGLLRESDCEAAQILSANGIAWDAVRNAVAQIPADAYREAQVQANQQTRAPLGDNPSADELERWIAPTIQHDKLIADSTAPISVAHPGTHETADIEAHLRRTQVVLGFVLGYGFGHWLSGWPMGLVLGAVGLGVASCRIWWFGFVVGGGCGLFLPTFIQPDDALGLSPGFLCILGAFFGSFLGDCWRFPVVPPESPPAEDDELYDARKR